MRLILLAAIAAVLVPASAGAQEVPTRVRDCLGNTEFGIEAPTSNRPNAKWLYIVSIMKSTGNGAGTYGSEVSWKVSSSLEEACNTALAEFPTIPENNGWVITGAVVQLVPDSIVQQGLEH